MSLSKQLYIIISIIFFMIFAGNFIISVKNTKEYLEIESITKAQDTATSLGMSLKTLLKDKYDPEMVAEREDFFELMHKVNEVMQPDKIRMNELDKENPQDIEEFELLKEHHKLMLEQLLNFYR